MPETPAIKAACPCICHLDPLGTAHVRACCAGWEGDLMGDAGKSLPYIVERAAQLLDTASLVVLTGVKDATDADHDWLACRAQTYADAAEIVRGALGAIPVDPVNERVTAAEAELQELRERPVASRGLHQAIAREIRNFTMVRFSLPAEDRGPTHFKDGEAWVTRLSLSEADCAAYAAMDALEELGVLASPVPSRDELRRRVCGALREAGYPRAGQADFGWQHHRAIDFGAHMLITCTPSEMWQTMPGDATATAVHYHLTRWSDALTEAGLGVHPWGRDERTEVLIVAADQATADEQALTVAPHLAERNPSGCADD